MAGPKSDAAPQRLFTIDEANRTLPLVRAIVADIVRQFEVVNNFKQRRVALRNSARRPGGGLSEAIAEEAAACEDDLEREEAQLLVFVEELARLGVELKGPDGLCDFPSLRDGREVYLCWRLGEPTVQFWHEINAGFAGRQPLRDPGV